jgi:ABC-type lipoprotein export system ATPase subunit
LSFAGVTVRGRAADSGRMLLREVSFELEAGETAGLYGSPKSGKSTLLRLASGVQLAQEGRVRFAGTDLHSLSQSTRARLLRGEIALLSPDGWLPAPGETALDCVAVALGSIGFGLREGRRRGLALLDRMGEAASAQEPVTALSLGQRARVELARALCHEPRLLLVDEPAPLPNIQERERFCGLLRALATEHGLAMLIVSQDITALQGLDMLMSISAGEVCGATPRAEVVPLSPRSAAAGSAS